MRQREIVRVTGLRKTFDVRGSRGRARVTAVAGVDFAIMSGETVGLVGESGSGKTTIARCIGGLTAPTSGEILVDGKRVGGKAAKGVLRDGSVQMVFQDPQSSINPLMSVRQLVDEPLRLLRHVPRSKRTELAIGLLNSVGLDERFLARRPAQLSGGQRQRVGLARALAGDPKVMLLDEPTASLDALVRSRIVELLMQLQQDRGLAYLLITHDLSLARRLASRVVVLYLGRVVEQGTVDEVLHAPVHPYTRALLDAVPTTDFSQPPRRARLAGEVPSTLNLPTGCPLAGRCSFAQPSCSVDPPPPLTSITDTHSVACPVVLGSLHVPPVRAGDTREPDK